VCIARFSITLGQSVGMALVEEPLAKEGTGLEVFEPGCGGRLKSAQVVPMPFYDPEGKRMKM
jgi:sarcosine oxidase, subunit alpha